MWTRSNQTGRPLNVLLKLVTLCSHGSEDPNQHQKAAMFVSTWRLSFSFHYTPVIFKFFMQTQHSLPDAVLGRDVALDVAEKSFINLFFLIQSWNMFVDIIWLMPTV